MLSLPHLSHVHSSLLHISHIFLSFPQLQTLSYISISHLLSHRTPKFLHLIQNQPPLFFPCFSFCLCFCAFFIVVCNVFQCVPILKKTTKTTKTRITTKLLMIATSKAKRMVNWVAGASSKLSATLPLMTRSTSFPPPLTSISSRGGGGLQVRPHREDGRLVIEAVAIPACHSYFHADRSDGRLRLQLLKDCFQNCNNEATKEEDDEQVVEEDGEVEADEEAVEGGGNEDESDETDGESAHWGEEEKEEEEEEEEMEGTGGNVAGEIELGKLPRPSRCMEGAQISSTVAFFKD
ncbi:unnamed protein product, partial [Vitis vinifera]